MIEKYEAMLSSPAQHLNCVSDIAVDKVLRLEEPLIEDASCAKWIGPRGHKQGYAFMVIMPYQLRDGRRVLLNLGWSSTFGQLPQPLPTKYVKDLKSESAPWFNKRLPVKSIEELSRQLETEPIMLKSIDDHAPFFNRHLEYVFTWYTMGILSVLFGRLKR